MIDFLKWRDCPLVLVELYNQGLTFGSGAHHPFLDLIIVVPRRLIDMLSLLIGGENDPESHFVRFWEIVSILCQL